MWLDRIVPARAASFRSLEFDRYCVCFMKISEMKRNLFFFAAYANHWKLLSQILVCSTVLECVFIGWNSTTDEIVELFEQVLLLKFSMISFFCKGVTI